MARNQGQKEGTEIYNDIAHYVAMTILQPWLTNDQEYVVSYRSQLSGKTRSLLFQEKRQLFPYK